MKVLAKVYENCKYEKPMNGETKDYKEVSYEITGFEVVSGDKAAEIEAHTDGSCIDEYHEYLVLHLKDGDTATFRNSHVDLFRI